MSGRVGGHQTEKESLGPTDRKLEKKERERQREGERRPRRGGTGRGRVKP